MNLHRRHLNENWRVAIGERSAILEYDNRVPHADADRRAVAEFLDRPTSEGSIAPGILGELIAAAARRSKPPWNDVGLHLGFADAKAPLWGYGLVVPDGRSYRPADDGENAHPAIIVGAFDDGRLVDLVAHGIRSGRHLSRLESVGVLGANAVETARELGEPLLVFPSVHHWLRANCRGAVIIDWERAAYSLCGVELLLCHQDIAPRLYAATRACVPPPRIGVSTAAKEMRHAA